MPAACRDGQWKRLSRPLPILSDVLILDELRMPKWVRRQSGPVGSDGLDAYRPADTKKALATLSKLGYRRYYVSDTGRELCFLSY
jgi:hypothetical protein